MTIDIKWFDSGREPQCPPNPDFPDGMDIDVTVAGQKGCKTKLPYPAKRCGYYTVKCRQCGYCAIVTTAGRPDDPKSVKLPCRSKQDAKNAQ
jgi:hypothetical protein